jgi:hypothetical protein
LAEAEPTVASATAEQINDFVTIDLIVILNLLKWPKADFRIALASCYQLSWRPVRDVSARVDQGELLRALRVARSE